MAPPRSSGRRRSTKKLDEAIIALQRSDDSSLHDVERSEAVTVSSDSEPPEARLRQASRPAVNSSIASSLKTPRQLPIKPASSSSAKTTAKTAIKPMQYVQEPEEMEERLYRGYDSQDWPDWEAGAEDNAKSEEAEEEAGEETENQTEEEPEEEAGEPEALPNPTKNSSASNSDQTKSERTTANKQVYCTLASANASSSGIKKEETEASHQLFGKGRLE
jgi:hypothetical protein